MANRFGLSLVTVLGALVGFATESSTIAFYPFADQAAGTEIDDGETVANAVSSAYPGTIKRVRNSTNPYGTATFDEDVPGQYVYSDWTGMTLLTDKAQSLHFKGENGKDGAGVSFYELADELYRRATEENEDFTLEFFWKMPVRTEQVTREFINNLALFDQKRGVCVGHAVDGVNKQLRPYTGASVKNPTVNYPGTLFDGLWHHMAIAFNHTSKKYQFTLDYKVAENSVWTEAEPMTPPETKYIALGSFRDAANNASYITDIKIAAPRISTGILATDKLLMAVNGPVATKPALPESGAVFLTTGVAGTAGTVLTSVPNEALPAPEKEIDPADLAERIYPVQNSKMPIADFSQFMYTDTAALEPGVRGRQTTIAVDVKGDYSLVSGETELVKKDIYSLCTSPVVANPTGARFARGTALTYPDTTEEGNRSFTAEVLLKWDLANWKEEVLDIQKDLTTKRYYATMMAIPTTTNANIAVVNLQAVVDESDDVTFILRTLGTDGEIKYTSIPSMSLSLSRSKLEQKFCRLALVYDENVPNVTIYAEGNSYCATLKGPLDFSVADSWRFFDGLNAHAFTGWVDAVRISRGVVAPENFLKRKSNGGFCVSIR